MGFHHLALAIKDIEKTHRFYTEAMGFTLAKVEVVPKDGGFARHVFYPPALRAISSSRLGLLGRADRRPRRRPTSAAASVSAWA